MLVTYYFDVRDGSNALVPGLRPSWQLFARLDDSAPVTPPPPVEEVGGGVYRYAYDAAARGDAVAITDCGATITDPGQRHQTLYPGREAGIILGSSRGQVRAVVVSPGVTAP